MERSARCAIHHGRNGSHRVGLWAGLMNWASMSKFCGTSWPAPLLASTESLSAGSNVTCMAGSRSSPQPRNVMAARASVPVTPTPSGSRSSNQADPESTAVMPAANAPTAGARNSLELLVWFVGRVLGWLLEDWVPAGLRELAET